jgi:hypothetical protein
MAAGARQVRQVTDKFPDLEAIAPPDGRETSIMMEPTASSLFPIHELVNRSGRDGGLRALLERLDGAERSSRLQLVETYLAEPTSEELPARLADALRLLVEPWAMEVVCERLHPERAAPEAPRLRSGAIGIIGMILGILSFMFSFALWGSEPVVVIAEFLYLPWLVVPTLIVSAIGLQARRKGRGLALAGLILGVLALIMLLSFAWAVGSGSG